MKSFLPLVICTAMGSVALAAEGDLQKRVEALEYQGFENTLSWSGFFETRFDQVTFKPDVGDKSTMNLSRNLAGIDFRSKPLPNVSVFGRFTYSNVFNNLPTASGSGVNLGRTYASNEVVVERLFLNYGVIEGLTLSVGRLPTLDGPPTHIYDGLSRQGSYPRQVYSSALDGYALTYNIPLNSQTQSLSARLVYTPLSEITVTNSASGVGVFEKTEVKTPAGVGTGVFHNSTVPLTSWMLDYSWDNSGFAQNVSAIYQGFKFSDLKVPGWKADYMINSLYLEFKDIASTGLTVYESYTKTKLVNEGGVTLPTGGSISFGANKADATIEGTINITGLVYTLPVAAMKNPLIGYEMYSADKNSVQFDAANRDAIGFYVQRGKGNHIFYTQPLNNIMKLRLGMMDSKPEYAPGLAAGEFAKTKDTTTAIYANLRTDF
ncbi:MAG TPA: DUF3373 family protein [Oligoflexus sp.]|uniref:DUF3373 family protein n=1 Tax=Oligoflexus sp. TaxID=1971216 RepID=UPI002D235F09|nr:DUF3373 family protein [Oligoflexus sp.]HYX36722.1 DUF3373 family protein [Oligoflexus sp.]